jgi:hypothetical protein
MACWRGRVVCIVAAAVATFGVAVAPAISEVLPPTTRTEVDPDANVAAEAVSAPSPPEPVAPSRLSYQLPPTDPRRSWSPPVADDGNSKGKSLQGGKPNAVPASARLQRQSTSGQRLSYQLPPHSQRRPWAAAVPQTNIRSVNFLQGEEDDLQGQGDRVMPISPVPDIVSGLLEAPIVTEYALGLPVGPPERFWFEADYLFWWIKGMKNTPPLVTTSDQFDKGVLIPGNSTQVLYPTEALFRTLGSGGRIRFGYWWDTTHASGIEADGFGLSAPRARFRVASDGDPLLARPFFNTDNPQPDAEVIASTSAPGIPPSSGNILITGESDLYSAGVRWRWNLSSARRPDANACSASSCYFSFLPRGDIRLDWTFGYRYMRLSEQLSISANIVPTISGATRFDILDQFKTSNDFHAAEVGLHYGYHHCRWSFDLLPRVAFGNTRQRIEINGSTLATSATSGSVQESGGLLALEGTNIGHYRRDRFSFMPSVEAMFGCQISNRLKATLGYSFLYWLEVARPGEQIDSNVNPEYLPTSNPIGVPGPKTGPRDPSPQMGQSAFWAQGLNLGLEYRF